LKYAKKFNETKKINEIYQKKSQNYPKFEQGVLNNVRMPHKKNGAKKTKKQNLLLLAWSHKENATRPSPTVPWLDLVISQRTRSSDLGVVVGLFVYSWCECGVHVWG